MTWGRLGIGGGRVGIDEVGASIVGDGGKARKGQEGLRGVSIGWAGKKMGGGQGGMGVDRRGCGLYVVVMAGRVWECGRRDGKEEEALVVMVYWKKDEKLLKD